MYFTIQLINLFTTIHSFAKLFEVPRVSPKMTVNHNKRKALLHHVIQRFEFVGFAYDDKVVLFLDRVVYRPGPSFELDSNGILAGYVGAGVSKEDRG